MDDTAARIRELNEKVIAAAKQSGTHSLDAYEKTPASVLSFGEKVAGATRLDWVSALAKAHATFVTETTAAFTAAARDALKQERTIDTDHDAAMRATHPLRRCA